MKRLNIAIIGLGNIGGYLFKYLNDNKKILTEKVFNRLSSELKIRDIKIEKNDSELNPKTKNKFNQPAKYILVKLYKMFIF